MEDYEELNQPDPMHVRSSTDPSFHSSQCSISDLGSDEFYELCKARLKVSKHNKALQLKIKGKLTIPQLSFSYAEQFEESAQKNVSDEKLIKTLNKSNLRFPAAEKFDLLSTIPLFLIKDKHLQTLIPDYEISSCKEIFTNSNCHESYFGLGRLLAYEGKFFKALEYFNLALDLRQDRIYKTWQIALTVKITKNVESEAIQSRSLFSSLMCCNAVRRQASIVESLHGVPEGLETYWSFMELAMRGVPELEQPEYYATRIRNISAYFGYLAWSEVYFRRNEWHKGLDILKQLIIDYDHRPEAYVKLWYHYYYHVKDYEQAHGVLSEAFLIVSSQDFHDYYILFCLYHAKTLFRLKRVRECIDHLQRKFYENPTFPLFLYNYGRYCTKSEDYMYNGTAIGALHECARLCDGLRYGKIYYWLAKAYMLGRQHIEAYDTVKMALLHLDPSFTIKMAELKRWMTDIQVSIQKIAELEKILENDLDAKGYKRCKELCIEVKDLHKLTVDVLYAKMLWKTGRHEDALKKLYAVSGISTVKMNAHFLLIQYLGEQNNIKCLKTVACEMVIKCKNPQVPAHIWVKVNLLYAKILVKNYKPGKAILILKLIAKVLPPIPFASIPYTKFLQRATSLQELASAYSQQIESYNTYNYSSYKNSFISPHFEVRDLPEKLLSEEAAPLPIVVQNKFKERRSVRAVSEKVNETKMYHKKRTQENVNEESEEKKQDHILGIAIPDVCEFKSISVCSDATFLYKIAKIALRHNTSVHDGMCAIKDYIELLRFEKQAFKVSRMMKKAEEVRAGLRKLIKDE